MVRRGNVAKLIGKTIKDVIVVTRIEDRPRCHVFILFDDNTHYEFFGEDISPTGGVDEGGSIEILNYHRNSGAHVQRLAA